MLGVDLWSELHFTRTHCTAGTATTTTRATHTTTGPDDTITSPKTSQLCPASNAVLASVITGIVTAILATIVFLLVQFAVCKHFHRTPDAAKSAAMAGGEELAVYEKIDGREGGRAGGAVKLEENAAYGVAITVK